MTQALSMRLALSASVMLFAAGCSSSFDVKVPRDKVADFNRCMGNPDITYAAASALPAVVPPPSTVVAATFKKHLADTQAATLSALQTARVKLKADQSFYSTLNAESLAEIRKSELQVDLHERKLAEVASAQTAVQFLDHPVNAKINALYAQLADPDGGVAAGVSFTLSETHDYLTLTQDMIVSNGLDALRTQASELLRKGGDAEVAKTEEQAGYLSTYLKAYFRNGKFASVKVSLDDLDAYAPGLKQLPPAIRDEIKKVLDKATFGKIADEGFVSRTGTSRAFPPLNIAIDPTQRTKVSIGEIDPVVVGADMIRVIIEALFDRHDRLPGVTNATGLKVEKKPLNDIKAVKLMFDLDDDGFGKLDQIANSVDGGASSLAGQVVRGLNIAALNNEAIAKLLEALAGATARKVAEKGGWCYYYAVRKIEKEGNFVASTANAMPQLSVRNVRVTISN